MYIYIYIYISELFYFLAEMLSLFYCSHITNFETLFLHDVIFIVWR